MKILTREQRRRIAFWKLVIKTMATVITGSGIIFLTYLYINRADAGAEVPILMYHNVLLESSNDYEISEERFLEDMLYLKSKGYTPLLPDDFIKIANGEKQMPLKPIMITFDDGYYGNYEYAYPIIKATDMKATVAVIASNIHSNENHIPLPYKNYDIYQQPTKAEIENSKTLPTFMSWQQCLEMYESDTMAIESHTYDLHNPSTGGAVVPGGPNGIEKINGEEKQDYYNRIRDDLSKSILTIENKVGNDVKYFAYPYGQTEKDAFTILEELGIEMATTTRDGIAKTGDNLLSLARLNITMENSAEEVVPKSKATLKNAKIYLGSKGYKVDSYVVDKEHYIKLRDFEELLQGTSKEFNIVWNGETKQIEFEIPNNATAVKKSSDEEAEVEENDEDMAEPGIVKNIELDSQVLKVKARNIDYSIEIYSINETYYVRATDLNKVLQSDMVISEKGDRVQITI